MSFWKTFKQIAERGTINGVNYGLEEYVSYYYAYSRIDKDNGSYEEDKVDLADFILDDFKGRWGNEIRDQYGNQWYKDGGMTGGLWIAYANGVKLNDEPKCYYSACQLISKDANLPKDDRGEYEYCYGYMRKCYDIKSYKAYKSGEYVPNYDDMFEVKFKVGDRVFYVKEYDSDSRNGWRRQIESFVVKDVTIGGGKVTLYNHNHKDKYFCFSHDSIKQDYVASSVEELCKWYKGTTLYMWHRNGRCSIEPCDSTDLYMRYNARDND